MDRNPKATAQYENTTTVDNTNKSISVFVRKFNRLIWILTGMMEALLGFRLLFKLMAANPDSAFVSWIYQASGYLIQPFINSFRNISVGQGVLEISVLIALLAYSFLAWLLIEITKLLVKR